MDNNNILISGAGIAGTTLAFWLKKFGFNPTIIEVAPELRKGGYAIDFMGAGYDIAEKMEILPALEKADMDISKLLFVDRNNRKKGAMNYQKIKQVLGGRAITLLRSDLAKAIYNSLDKDTEIIFGDTITAISQDENEVRVTFQNGTERKFDLLVGADGLHSKVRDLLFGPEKQFEKYFGYYTCSYTIDDFVYEGTTFSMYNEPLKQAAIYSGRENKTMTFFIFTAPQKIRYEHHDVEAQKKILKTEFRHCGWKCPELLSKADATKDFYFDSISQIQMEKWAEGRVTLVGDACYCPSLLSGKGSTLAMAGAYILAGELKHAKGNYKVAFEAYQTIFMPFMKKKQKSAQSFAKSFVPKSEFGIWMRNLALKMMALPFVTKLIFNQFMDNDLKLKDY